VLFLGRFVPVIFLPLFVAVQIVVSAVPVFRVAVVAVVVHIAVVVVVVPAMWLVESSMLCSLDGLVVPDANPVKGMQVLAAGSN